MIIVRIGLHALRIGLCGLLIVQILQMISALHMLNAPDAFAVSSFLLAALVFKGVLMLLNLALLWLAHIGIRRLRNKALPIQPDTCPPFTGES